MRGRKRTTAGGAALVTAFLLLPAPPAPAATTQEVEFTARYAKGDRNKERGGISLRTTIRITDNAGAPAPLQLTHTTLRFPKGAKVNARFFPKCNPAALRQRGPRACPAKSRIGSGRAIGLAPPVVTDPVNAKVTLFNGTMEGRNPVIIIYALPDLGPVMTLPGVLRSGRGTPYGYVLDTPVPPIKTLPSAPDASVTLFDATTRDVTVRRRGRTIHYIDSPVLCDGTFFMLDGQFTYQGATKVDVLERFTLRGGPRCP
ncbi:MAG TPA: hypothetical protein VFB51_12525 [Solirubrobacterales bacterium]|nr:hypothetical protein [Solirubrobacterales bacterium]